MNRERGKAIWSHLVAAYILLHRHLLLADILGCGAADILGRQRNFLKQLLC